MVHRAHGFELGAHFAIRLIAGRKFVAADAGDCGIGQQGGTLDAQLVEASFRHVRVVSLQLGGGGLQLAAAVAGLIKQFGGRCGEARRSPSSGRAVDLFKLQQALPRLTGIALGVVVGGLLLELKVLGFALQLFSGRRFDLRNQSMDALVHFDEQRVDASEYGSGGAMALLESRNPSHALRTGLCRIFPTLTQHAERFLSCRNLLLELNASLFECGNFRLPICDDGFLLGAAPPPAVASPPVKFACVR